MAPLASRAMLTLFSAAHVHDCWYGAITWLPSYMILCCFPCYHRSKAACYFVHCEFSGSVFTLTYVGYELNCRCNSQCDNCGNCFTTHQRDAMTLLNRWVEDVDVAERALQMWPNIKKYVSSFRATPNKDPQTASYAAIKEACENPLMVTQLGLFISVAKQLQPFLLTFQTDAPMTPFLWQSLKDLLLTFMGRFIKKYVL